MAVPKTGDIGVSLFLLESGCVNLVEALALHGESVDATWAEDFSALIKFAADKSRDAVVKDDHLCGTTREKQQMQAETINRSALRIRVIIMFLFVFVLQRKVVLYRKAEPKRSEAHGLHRRIRNFAKQFKKWGPIGPPLKQPTFCLAGLVRHCAGHFHTKLKGVTNVDLDAPMFANPSAFESLQVWYNTPPVRMLETCIHTLMHHMPGRLWFHRGAGPYLSKLEDVQRQIDRGTISSLFLTFAPKEHLIGHKVRVRDNMPELQTFLNS